MGLKEKLTDIQRCIKQLPDTEAISTLIEIAHENHPIIAQHAISGLSHLDSRGESSAVRVVEAMVSILLDRNKKRDATARRAAALALGQLGGRLNPEGRRIVIQALSVALGGTDLDHDALVNTIWALGELAEDSDTLGTARAIHDALIQSADPEIVDPHSDWVIDMLEEAIVKITQRMAA